MKRKHAIGTVVIVVYGAVWTVVGRFWLSDPGLGTIGGLAGLIVLFAVSGLRPSGNKTGEN